MSYSALECPRPICVSIRRGQPNSPSVRPERLRIVMLGFARRDRKWSLNDGQIPNFHVVRVALGKGYNRVEGNRRASRTSRVSDLPAENPNVAIRNLGRLQRPSGAHIRPADVHAARQCGSPRRPPPLLVGRVRARGKRPAWSHVASDRRRGAPESGAAHPSKPWGFTREPFNLGFRFDSSRASPPHRPREDELTRPADPSRTNLACA
jgi:hypothetical protein